MTKQKAYLNIMAGAALWGCTGIFLKFLTAAGLNSIQGMAARGLYAVAAYAIYLAIRQPQALKINPRHWYYFFGTGVCSLLFYGWCYFNTIANSSMAVAAVLLYTSPVFVTIMSAIVFKEAVTRRTILALVSTFAGCVLVTGLFPMGQERMSFMTIVFGLGSGFGYALYSIFGKFALEKYPPTTVSFYTVVFSTVFSLPISGLLLKPQLLLDWRSVVGAAGIGILCCALPYFLYTAGLQHADPSKAAILATVEPVVSALIGTLLFREAFTLYKLLGIVAILGAVFILNWPGKQATAPPLEK